METTVSQSVLDHLLEDLKTPTTIAEQLHYLWLHGKISLAMLQKAAIKLSVNSFSTPGPDDGDPARHDLYQFTDSSVIFMPLFPNDSRRPLAFKDFHSTSGQVVAA
jgi:hypothetical protein